MIVFDLQCRTGGERFEAWFHSNAQFEEQRGAGLVQCPYCQSAEVEKAPMAPMLPKRGNASDAFAKLASIQTEMLKQSTKEHIAYMVSKIPMGRLGHVDEVAALVCWLASAECSFSTGAVFDISGGRATY